MRTKRIVSAAIAVALLLLCCATAVHAFAVPPGWTVNQLTSGDNANQDPWVSGDRVAWYGSDGANLQIFTWKIGDSAPTTLTSAPHDSEGPAVSGDRVVWATEVDPITTQICTWKVGDSSPTTLTAGAHFHFGPQVSGDRVVWQGYTDATHSQTYTWKVGDSSATTLTTSASSNSNQAVSGDRVAWEGWDGAHDQIYTWKSGDSGPSMLTSVTGNGQAPEVSGDRAVWTSSNGSHSQIYTWAAGDTSATPVPSPVLSNSNPQVSGDRLVWQGYDGVAWHIYTWKSGDTSATQLTYGTYNADQNPQVSDDRIVWYGSGRVFTQKIGESEATTLSAPVGGLTWPQVSGDHVVWEGKDGPNWQVFDAESSNPAVDFPDPNLDAAVRAAIGKPEPDQIYASDLATLTVLNAGSKGITHLDGLQYATNLVNLELGGDHVTTITPIGQLTKLTGLGLWGCQVTTITPLANCKELAYVELGGNHVSDITALSSLNALTYLGLDDNQVADISPVVGLTNLVQLQLSQDRVTSVVPLIGLHNLQTLALGGNLISNVVPLSGLTNLSHLYLGGNDIWDASPLAGLSPTYADLSLNWLDFTPGSTASQTVDAWIAHGATPSNLTWLPQKTGGVLVGSVSSSVGGPLSGARVALSFGPSATTGSSGSYLLPIVPSVAETITISKPYYSSYTTTLSIDPDTSHTVNAVLTPVQLPLGMKRSPNGSSVSYKRKKGVAKFTLSVTLTDARGAVAGKYVWLQKSSNGKKWSNLYRLTTNASGKASKAFSAKKKSTTYYRWSAPVTPYDRAGATSKQKVVVK